MRPFFKKKKNSNTYLRNVLIKKKEKKEMLILAIKESLHFFHTYIKLIIFSIAYDIHIKWYFLTHLSSASLIYISSHASLLL